MKICFITTDLAHIGGQEKVLSIIANSLSQYKDIQITILFTVKDKHTKECVYTMNSQIEMIYDKKIIKSKFSYPFHKIIRVINKEVIPIKNLWILKHIYFPKKEIKAYEKFFQEHDFDIVVGLTPRPAGMLTFLDIRAKKIAWLHSTYDRYFNHPKEFQWNQNILYKELFPLLDKVIVLTDFDVNEYSEKFNMKPYKISNPLSLTCDKKSSLDKKQILFIGRLHYNIKGLDLLTEIILSLLEITTDFKVIVVGDGEGRLKFQRELEEKGLSKFFDFVGSTLDVDKYFCNASVCVVPSRKEGFGMVVTEAMECGVPVVSFLTTGPSEIIENGKTGFLIEKYNTEEFAKKIALIMLNDNLRFQLGKEAARKAKEFSLEVITYRWKQLLESLYQ